MLRSLVGSEMCIRDRNLEDLPFPETKTVNLSLPNGVVSKKKISLIVKEEGEHQIIVLPSAPESLLVAQNEMIVQGPSKPKVGLKFVPIPHVSSINHHLYVFKNREPWQKIIFKIKFSDNVTGENPDEDN
eukprot:TRINITY_DN11665_c0_g1_i3.p1 TRINITY_DN11665_c0_g1~~TRINITY_DN11665_c0_g1_i3.p1  ORF type:complete len:130 (-),score=37.05 TRINITY_DN11665_c0_g1_i3:125-514(-)